MKIGEVCLLTNDVPRLAAFYKELLGITDTVDDPVHQTLLAEETTLTLYNGGSLKKRQNGNISLAFTVGDMDKAYEKVLRLGAQVIEPPAARPWGAVNMSFYDPDGNPIYFRCFVD